MAKKIGYMRVSSSDQNLARQAEELARQNIDKLFKDKLSGKDLKRPGLVDMIAYIRDGEGDHIYVHELSRLGRSIIDLDSIVKSILAKGASITFLKEQITFDPNHDIDPIKAAMFGMLSVFAKFERDIIKQRQKEGIEIAIKKGTHMGRPAKLSQESKAKIVAGHKAGKNPTDLAKEFKVSRASIYNCLKINQ